jgi:hypothetical protein
VHLVTTSVRRQRAKLKRGDSYRDVTVSKADSYRRDLTVYESFPRAREEGRKNDNSLLHILASRVDGLKNGEPSICSFEIEAYCTIHQSIGHQATQYSDLVVSKEGKVFQGSTSSSCVAARRVSLVGKQSQEIR